MSQEASLTRVIGAFELSTSIEVAGKKGKGFFFKI